MNREATFTPEKSDIKNQLNQFLQVLWRVVQAQPELFAHLDDPKGGNANVQNK